MVFGVAYKKYSGCWSNWFNDTSKMTQCYSNLWLSSSTSSHKQICILISNKANNDTFMKWIKMNFKKYININWNDCSFLLVALLSLDYWKCQTKIKWCESIWCNECSRYFSFSIKYIPNPINRHFIRPWTYDTHGTNTHTHLLNGFSEADIDFNSRTKNIITAHFMYSFTRVCV